MHRAVRGEFCAAPRCLLSVRNHGFRTRAGCTLRWASHLSVIMVETRLEISQMRTYNLIAGLIMLVVAVAAGLWIANNVV